MAGLPLYELKKTLKYIRHKDESEAINNRVCNSHIRTMSLTGLTEQESLVSKGGISDRSVDKISEFEERSSNDQDTNIIANSAADLKKHVEDMISVRNGDLSKTYKHCPIHAGTECSEHNYKNYQELMEATTGMRNGDIVPVSSGDIYKSIKKLSYCTCNVRFAGMCVCVDNTKMDHCSCHQRSAPPACSCVSRWAGKYATNHCTCYSRTMNRCSCLNRSATIDCTCYSRCSCNGRKEFSLDKPNPQCLCNDKSIEGCSCNTKRLQECTVHYCNCYARSAICAEHNGSTYVGGFCDVNVNGSGFKKAHNEYAIRVNNSDYNNYGGAGIDYNETKGYKSCTCKQRCSCDAETILISKTVPVEDMTIKRTNSFTECDCVSRDTCYCNNRTGTPACTANTPPSCSSDEDGGYWWRCSCESRTAIAACQCNNRAVCDCVYRTGTTEEELNVLEDVMKIKKEDYINNNKYIQNP